MLKRGTMIGEIVDSLAILSSQIESRCRLGLTDLNKHVENFLKDILVATFNLKLRNLNDEQVNAKALDLVELNGATGFQVTSSADSAKVNSTLRGASELEEPPARVVILVAGERQTSYTIEPELAAKFDFDWKRDVWDLTMLSQQILGLELDRLKAVFDLVQADFDRIEAELETPDAAGGYPTTIAQYVEPAPTAKTGDFSVYINYQKSEYDYEASPDEVAADFALFSSALAELPRVTREFYAFLLERRDKDQRGDGSFIFDMDVMRRICDFPDIDGELRVLEKLGFVYVEPGDWEQSPYVQVRRQGKTDNFLDDLVDFIEHNGNDFHTPIVNLDFTSFGI